MGLLLVTNNSFEDGILAPLGLCILEKKFDLSNNTRWCPRERNALKRFFDAAQGTDWTNKLNWEVPKTSHCDWYGVNCSEGATIKLELENNGLSGQISTWLGRLTELQVLNLADNQLNKGVPETLNNLNRLKELSLKYNNLSGSIPSDLFGGMADLDVSSIIWFL